MLVSLVLSQRSRVLERLLVGTAESAFQAVVAARVWIVCGAFKQVELLNSFAVAGRLLMVLSATQRLEQSPTLNRRALVEMASSDSVFEQEVHVSELGAAEANDKHHLERVVENIVSTSCISKLVHKVS